MLTISFIGSPLETIIYLLCVAASLLCAYLLARAYTHGRTRLLIWSSICFAMMALNNLVVAIDVLLLPEVDLTIPGAVTALLAVAVLLYGFIWETP
jgi:hypothetical protein